MLEILHFTIGILSFLGYVAAVVYILYLRQYKEAILSLVVPFYVFRPIMRLPESNLKKILAISTMGLFSVFLFLGILIVVLTPPV